MNSGRTTRLTSAVCAAFLIAFTTPTASAAPEGLVRVQAEGIAPGEGSDARKAAVDNARTALVIDLLEQYSGSPDMRPFSSILDNRDRYIRSFRVLEQEREPDAFRVHVEAHVKANQLREDMAAAILPTVKDEAKVLVLIAERISDEDEFHLGGGRIAESELCTFLHKKGFQVLESNFVLSRYSEEDLFDRIAGDDEALARLAQEHDADVIIVGYATADIIESKRRANIVNSHANLRLRVLRAKDGSEVDAIELNADINSVSPLEGGVVALENAAAKATSPLLVAATLAANLDVKATEVIVTVEGVQEPAQLDALIQLLAESTIIGSVEPLVADETSARIRVEYDGPMAPLTEALRLARMPGFQLGAKRVVGREITLEILN